MLNGKLFFKEIVTFCFFCSLNNYCIYSMHRSSPRAHKKGRVVEQLHGADSVVGDPTLDMILSSGGVDLHDDAMTLPALKKSQSCCACKNSFVDYQQIAVLPCGHLFCLACVRLFLFFTQECLECSAGASSYRKIIYVKERESFEDQSMTMPSRVDCSFCAICLENFCHEQEIGILSCGHSFCCSCIDEALRYRKKCPVCCLGVHCYRKTTYFASAVKNCTD